MNPFGIHFFEVGITDLIRVTHDGKIVEGTNPVNAAAFAIHSRIHMAHPNINAACHAVLYMEKHGPRLGNAGSNYARFLAFYEHHNVFEQYSGLVLETSEGDEIAKITINKKALILQNHGLLTVGRFVESAAWWFITMERSCQAQLMANSVNGKDIVRISNDAASI